MKKTIAIFSILLSVLVASKSFANVELNPVYQQKLDLNNMHLKIDRNSDFYNPFAQASEVVVDFAHELVHITFSQKNTCDANQFCMAVMPVTTKVSFQLVDVVTSECGTIQYNAVLETENGLNMMVITNHQYNQCAKLGSVDAGTAISVVIQSETSFEQLAKLQ